jgi:hypothetical protein
MKAALINRYFDLYQKSRSLPVGWIAWVMDMWRIEAILSERYGYDIALNGSTTI